MGHKQIVLTSFLSVLPTFLSIFFFLFLPISLLAILPFLLLCFFPSLIASFFPLLLLMLHLHFAAFLFCLTLFLSFPVFFTSFVSLLTCFLSFLLSSFPTLFAPCYPFPKPSHQWDISRLSFPLSFFLACLLGFITWLFFYAFFPVFLCFLPCFSLLPSFFSPSIPFPKLNCQWGMKSYK